jgi:6-phosphogluconolactonase
VLTNEVSIAQNKMYTYLLEGGRINPENCIPRGDPGRAQQPQGTSGGWHGSRPSERPFFVRANRAEAIVEFQASKSSKAVKTASWCKRSINQRRADPDAAHLDPKIYPRTFYINSGGRLLVAEHNLLVNVQDGDTVKTVPAGSSVFRIGAGGKLTFVRKYDIDVGDKTMFWMGMVRP